MVASIPVGSLGHLTQRYLSGDHKHSDDQPRGGGRSGLATHCHYRQGWGGTCPEGF